MTKTIRAFYLFLFALLLPLAALAGPEGLPPEPQAWVNAGAARPITETPDSGARVLRTLAQGEAFHLLSLSGEWAEVLVFTEAGDPLAGWIEKPGLRPQEPGDGVLRAILSSPDPALRVPLRAQPRESGKILGKYYTGVTAAVLEQPADGWVRLRIGSLDGYIQSTLLSLDAPMGSVSSFIPTVTVSNPGDPGLTLRAAQSYQSEKLGAVSNGQTVRVLGVAEEFAHVITPDGRTGFMMAAGLSPQPVYADLVPQAPAPRPEGTLSVVDNPGGQGAHLRTRGSTASDSLGLYPNGTEVVVTGGTAYWKQVWVDGRTGYMMARLLRGFVPPEFQGD